MAPRTGATLMSLTVMVKISLSTRLPVPLSVTVIVTEGAVPPIGDAYGLEVIFDDCLNECGDVYFEAGDHMDLVRVGAIDFRDLMGNARHGVISQHI